MESRSAALFVVFALGVLSASKSFKLTVIFMLTALVISAASAFFVRRKAVFAIVMAVFFAAGAAAYTYCARAPSEYTGEYVVLRGRVCELPYSYDGEMYYYILQPRSLTYMGETVKFKNRVRLCTDKRYKFGDCIYASGFLEEFDEKLNDTGFNAKLYSKSRGISFKMKAFKSGYIEKYRSISARDTILYIQNVCCEYIDANYSGKPNAYLKAFITGDTRGFDDETKDNLIHSGARRFLYAPFIHISIIVFILGIFFGIFRTGRYRRDTIAATVLLIYCSFNGTRPVFLKALFFAAFVLLYRKKFGYINKADALSAAGIFTLAVNPFFLFDSGFVISMVYSALYIMFSEKLSDALSFTGRFRYSLSSYFIGIFGLLPVYAAFFNGAPLMELIIALAAVPLTVLIIVSFWVSMAVHIISGIMFPSDVFLSAFLYGFDLVAETAAEMPFSYVFIPTPTPYQTALYYSVLLGAYNVSKQRKNRDAVTFFFTVSICMTMIVTASYIRDVGKIKVMFVNVGQGDGAAVSVNYREKLLIDGGGSAVYSSFNEGRYVYVPFLRSRGITRASAIVTHYHKDHCQGITEAVRLMKIDTVYAPDCTPDDEMRRELVRAAEESGTRVEFVAAGDKITFASGLTIEFLSPDPEDLKSGEPNETSLVARVSYGSFSALFTGDATKAQEDKMLARGLVSKVDILKTAHHGSDTSSGERFVQTVQPYAAVISVGEENTYDLPDDEVLERLSPYKILRTDKNGNITVTADKNGVCAIQTYR